MKEVNNSIINKINAAENFRGNFSQCNVQIFVSKIFSRTEIICVSSSYSA